MNQMSTFFFFFWMIAKPARQMEHSVKFLWIYLTYPFGKEPTESILERGGEAKRTFCLSHLSGPIRFFLPLVFAKSL